MKQLFICVLCVAYSAVALAQRSFILTNADRRAFINVSVGVSTPVGSPLKDNFEMPLYLMATKGSYVNLSGGYRLDHRFGIMASVTNCLNNADATQLIENAQKGGIGGNFTANVGTWNCAFVAAGPYVTYTTGLFSIDARMLGGYAMVQRPSTYIKGEYAQLPTSIITTTDYSNNFMAGLGTTVKYRVGRNIALTLNADYYTTRANFDSITTTLKVENRITSNTTRESKAMGSLNLGGGISMLF